MKETKGLSIWTNKDTQSIALHEIISNMPEHVYWKDINGAYLGCNDKQAHSWGLSRISDVVGKTDLQLLSWDEKSAREYHENDKKVMREGKPQIFEEEVKLANGQITKFVSHKTPLRDHEGNIIGILGISTDITARKLAEEKQSIALRELINNMPGHVYWKDINGVYLGCNDKQAQSLGLNKGSDVVGKTDFDLSWNDKAQELQNNDKKIMREGKQQIFEEEVQLPHGKIAIFLSHKTPLRDHSGNIIGILGISTDITERKLAEEREKIALADAAKQQAIAETEAELRQAVMILTGSIAHDIRTPLMCLGMDGNFLAKKLPILLEAYKLAINANLPLSEEIEDRHLNHLAKLDKSMAGSVREMEQFINTTLKTLKVGVKKDIEKDDLMRCSMWHCLHNTLLRYPFLPGQKELVIWKSGDFNYPFMGNEILMTRVFTNLLKNSLEQITKNGKGNIFISTEKGDDVNTIRFKDTAGGASPEIVDSIFEGYKTTKTKGTGIGLAFCRLTLESFGGSITCKSIENESIEFTITLPNPGDK